MPTFAGEPGRRHRLAQLMQALADDPYDGEALHALLDEYGVSIRGTVRRHLRDVGVPRPSAETLDELAVDVVLELVDLAAAWRPDGGALPWVWAFHRVRRLVVDHVGQHTDVLDVERLAGEPQPAVVAADDGRPAIEVLRAARHPQLLHLLAVADGHVSDLHLEVWLEHQLQKLGGDPSPATTVAERYGLSGCNVRQIASRTRRKLAGLLAASGADLALAA